MAGKQKKVKKINRGALPFGVCVLSSCVVRKSPSDKAEIISQLLFGECVEVILKKHNAWMKIRCVYDDYVGWIDSKQVVRISEEEKNAYITQTAYSFDLMQSVSTKDHTIPILLGSSLPKFDGLHCFLHDEKFVYNGAVIDPSQGRRITEELVERIARKYIHAPYLWGGRSIFGIDCSGFTQQVFKLLGRKLPRDSSVQVHEGEVVHFIELAQVGDLAFFENDEKKITHVGIILPGNMIIHASGKVRIDKLDQQGIYNTELKKYTHKFRVLKRVIEIERIREEE